MLSIDYTQKLLNLQGVLVKKVTSVHSFTMIDIEMPVTPHACPHCDTHTSYIHDYRRQLIKDIPAFGQAVILNYRRRRYRCPHCGKCFSEQHHFVPRYHRMTSRLVAHIIDQLRCECSFTSVAKSVNLSVSTVIRVFDILLILYINPYHRHRLICINMMIMMDAVNIPLSVYKSHLLQGLKQLMTI